MDCILTTSFESPLGTLVLGAIDEGVCLVGFPARAAGDSRAVERRMGRPLRTGRHPHLDALTTQLGDYFSGRLTRFTVPLVAAGTAFQQRVWQQLQEIPYGVTWSYEQLARAVGVESGQRAVGHANGSNPIAIVIPCHRVINKSGRLGGYGGELWRKQALLALERGTPTLDLQS